ncbi:MAG: hypothetical protein Q4G02_03125, partial [bacterium]|nr:hypothetical protein [bacterium]
MRRLLAKWRLFDWLVTAILFILAFLLTFDLFFSAGRPITYDGAIHITNIANFSQALAHGQFPVVWANDFANFGLPTPLFVQQLPFYVGAAINFFTHDVVSSFNILCLLSLFLSAVFFYVFLLIYFPRPAAALSSVLFMVAPYRLLNLYSRGAMPELFVSIFVPLAAIGFYFLIKKRKYILGFALTSLSLMAMLLSHPMMSVIYIVLLAFYALFLLIQVYLEATSWSKFWQKEKLALLNLAVAGVTALCLAGYYLMPLVLEVKYLTQGQVVQYLRAESGLTFGQLWSSVWPYWQSGSDVGPRVHALHIGALEGTLLIVGVLTILGWLIWRKKWRGQEKYFLALFYVLLVALILLFLLSESSTWLFLKLPFLSQVQHHWRFLAAMLFLPPLVLALFMQIMTAHRWFFWVAVILVFCNTSLVFSQAYGKNYLAYDQERYYFTRHNLHGNDLETVWSGGTGVLPAKTVQTEIVEGTGKLTFGAQTDIKRELVVEASESVRLVDYTYYFPGWTLIVNGQEQALEFQDP